MYKLYDAETMEPFVTVGKTVPYFATLDDVEDYLDGKFEAFDCVDDTDEGTTYECSDGENMTYLIAVWEV